MSNNSNSNGIPGTRKNSNTYKYIIAIDFGNKKSSIAISIIPPSHKKENEIQIEIIHASSISDPSSSFEKIETTITYINNNSKNFAIGKQAILTHIMDGNDNSVFAKNFLSCVPGNLDLNRKIVLRNYDNSFKCEKLLLDVIKDYLSECKRIAFENILKSAKLKNIPIPKKSEIKWIISTPSIWNEKTIHVFKNSLSDIGFNQFEICSELQGIISSCFYEYFKVYSNENIDGKSFLVIDIGNKVNISTFKAEYVVGGYKIDPMNFYSAECSNIYDEFEKKIISHILTDESCRDFKTFPCEFDIFNRLGDLGERDIAENRNFRVNPCDLEFSNDAIKKLQLLFPKYKEQISKSRKAILMPAMLCGEIFDCVIDPIITLLNQINGTHKFHFAFLVGENSSCYVNAKLQNFLLEKYNMKLFITPSPALDIVKGAVRVAGGVNGIQFGNFSILEPGKKQNLSKPLKTSPTRSRVIPNIKESKTQLPGYMNGKLTTNNVGDLKTIIKHLEQQLNNANLTIDVLCNEMTIDTKKADKILSNFKDINVPKQTLGNRKEFKNKL